MAYNRFDGNSSSNDEFRTFHFERLVTAVEQTGRHTAGKFRSIFFLHETVIAEEIRSEERQ